MLKRAQTEEIETKIKAFHTKFPEIFSASMERNYQTTMKEIHTFKTIVDNTNILIKVFGDNKNMKTLSDSELDKEDSHRVFVPVVFQLDLPASWNRTKVLENIDEMRLNVAYAMNVKIRTVSSADLNIYSDITRDILSKVDLLQAEIKQMMSGMLSDAALDTKENAEVGVDLIIPDMTACSADLSVTNSLLEIEHADNIASVDDDKTQAKTNSREENNSVNSEDEVKLTETISVIDDDKIRVNTDLGACLEEISFTNSQDEIEHADNIASVDDDKTQAINNSREEDNSVNSEDEVKLTETISVIDDDKIRVNTDLGVCVNLRQQIKLTETGRFVCDCVIINSQMVIADNRKQRLLIYDTDGHYNCDINLSARPWFIAVINNSHVAVSFRQSYIDITNIYTGKVINKMPTSSETYGISYHNGLLYVVIDKSKIDVMNLKGEKFRSFPCPSAGVWYLATDTERIYFTDADKDSVYCCNLYGSVKWKFTNDKMSKPRGVTIDIYGNVYVACLVSSNVIVISPDEIHYTEVLTEKNELHFPIGIHYGKTNHRLLVCNEVNHDTFLYDVEISTS